MSLTAAILLGQSALLTSLVDLAQFTTDLILQDRARLEGLVAKGKAAGQNRSDILAVELVTMTAMVITGLVRLKLPQRQRRRYLELLSDALEPPK